MWPLLMLPLCCYQWCYHHIGGGGVVIISVVVLLLLCHHGWCYHHIAVAGASWDQLTCFRKGLYKHPAPKMAGALQSGLLMCL